METVTIELKKPLPDHIASAILMETQLALFESVVDRDSTDHVHIYSAEAWSKKVVDVVRTFVAQYSNGTEIVPESQIWTPINCKQYNKLMLDLSTGLYSRTLVVGRFAVRFHPSLDFIQDSVAMCTWALGPKWEGIHSYRRSILQNVDDWKLWKANGSVGEVLDVLDAMHRLCLRLYHLNTGVYLNPVRLREFHQKMMAIAEQSKRQENALTPLLPTNGGLTHA